MAVTYVSVLKSRAARTQDDDGPECRNVDCILNAHRFFCGLRFQHSKVEVGRYSFHIGRWWLRPHRARGVGRFIIVSCRRRCVKTRNSIVFFTVFFIVRGKLVWEVGQILDWDRVVNGTHLLSFLLHDGQSSTADLLFVQLGLLLASGSHDVLNAAEEGL